MATVILVRHGRTSANAAGTLAGRLPGVRLDEVGLEQAARTAERIAAVPLASVVSSPLERCRQTATAIVGAHPATLRVRTDRGLTECDYGEWQGRPLKELAREKLWATVQAQPSAATARACIWASPSPSGPGNTAADGCCCTTFHRGCLVSSLIVRPVQSP